jgi:ketosteroid isomerase-like protein
MSHQNVEIVQGVYEALNRGDLAAVLEKIDPDFEWWQNTSTDTYSPETAASPRQSSRLPVVSAGAPKSSNPAASGVPRETPARVGTR